MDMTGPHEVIDRLTGDGAEHSVDLGFQRIGDRVAAYIERQQGPKLIRLDVKL
ncbi:hypothetical protein D3C79_992780 [compost metagenome]|jgi:hypothetical protein